MKLNFLYHIQSILCEIVNKFITGWTKIFISKIKYTYRKSLSTNVLLKL